MSFTKFTTEKHAIKLSKKWKTTTEMSDSISRFCTGPQSPNLGHTWPAACGLDISALIHQHQFLNVFWSIGGLRLNNPKVHLWGLPVSKSTLLLHSLTLICLVNYRIFSQVSMNNSPCYIALSGGHFAQKHTHSLHPSSQLIPMPLSLIFLGSYNFLLKL